MFKVVFQNGVEAVAKDQSHLNGFILKGIRSHNPVISYTTL
jgi:hypothetical protein